MISDNFRIKHSTVIEHYQFIESHLEGIYAQVRSFCDNKMYISALKDVEKHNIGRLLADIRRLETSMGVRLLDDDCVAEIQAIMPARNFWCHNCYYDMPFDKTGNPRNPADEKRLDDDIKTARRMRDKLFSISMDISAEYPYRLF